MNPQDHDHTDDDDFDAFLQGKGELSQMLQQMPQPTPPAALSAAILADAEAAVRQNSSANDAFIADSEKRPRLSRFLRRARLPLAMAASVLLAVVIGVQWQSQFSEPGAVVIAQAPQPPAAPATAESTAARSKAPDARKSTAELAGAQKQVPSTAQTPMPTTVISQADISQANPDSVVFRSVPSATSAQAQPAAAPAPVAPVAASPTTGTSPGDLEKARAWLKLIDELIKADMNRDALDEWEKFRKDYPHYTVPEELMAKVKALKR